jgi:putative endonuclease
VSDYYVYIMTNRSGTLYVGVTNDLERRVFEHKTGTNEGFTKRYKMTRLIHFESTTDVRDAVAREKQIKGWTRARKIALVREINPRWRDLAADWYTVEPNFGGVSSEGQILRCSQNDNSGALDVGSGELQSGAAVAAGQILRSAQNDAPSASPPGGSK